MIKFAINEFIQFSKGFGFSSAPVDLSVVADLQEKGLALKEKFLSPEGCVKVISAIDDYLNQVNDDEVLRINGDERIFSAEEKIDEVKFFNYHDDLRNIGEAHLRQKLFCSTLAARIKFEPGNLGSGNGWHRDSLHSQYKTILYLCDVNSKNGPFQYIEGTHQLASKFQVQFSNSDYSMSSLRFGEPMIASIEQSQSKALTQVEGRAGDLLFADTSGIHRGSPLKEGVRYALTNYYFTESQLRKTKIITEKAKERLLKRV